MPSPSPQSTFDQQELSFVCDGLRISGMLHRPPTDNPPVVIGSHGLFSNGDSPKQIALAEALNAFGIAFLRLDHRGCGHSEGQFDTVTSLVGRAHDLIAAVRVLEHSIGTPLVLGLFGSSFGGATCLAAAPRLSPARMVTLAAPLDSRSLWTTVSQNGDGTLPPLMEAEQLQFDLRDRLQRVHNLLVIHGEADAVVPVVHARQIFAAVGAPKQLIINPKGDHRVSDPDHQRIFIAACQRWFQNLLTLTQSESPSC